MERAAGAQVGASPLELDAFADHIDDVEAGDQVVNE